MPMTPARPIPPLLAHLLAHAPAHTPPPAGTFIIGTPGADALAATAISRFIEGAAGNDTLTGGSGDDNMDGGRGVDSLIGNAGADRLFGGLGSDSDSLNGGPGADTLAGGGGADALTGGAGNDAFLIGGPGFGPGPHPAPLPATAAGLDHILDFTHGEDRIVFGPHDAATAANFATATAADYTAALAAANARIAAGTSDYVAVKVGADVIVFADSHHDNGTADSAVLLVGKSLADIGYSDII